jgi:hypothetical protein
MSNINYADTLPRETNLYCCLNFAPFSRVVKPRQPSRRFSTMGRTSPIRTNGADYGSQNTKSLLFVLYSIDLLLTPRQVPLLKIYPIKHPFPKCAWKPQVRHPLELTHPLPYISWHIPHASSPVASSEIKSSTSAKISRFSVSIRSSSTGSSSLVTRHSVLKAWKVDKRRCYSSSWRAI